MDCKKERQTGETHLRRIYTLFIIIIVLSGSVSAQTRRRSTPRTPSASTTATKAAEVQRQGASQIAEQIKNLTRFVYLLGGAVKGIEAQDEAIRRREASPAIEEQTRRNKQSIRTSIQGVKDGLDKLELQFRTTPELNRYYISLAGVAAKAAAAEEQAAANQFDLAGRALIEAVNRLTDVLKEM